MRTIKDKVEAILRDYPETRNSDKVLIKVYWKTFHSDLISSNDAGDWIFLENLIRMPSTETIRRMRQQIQNKEGKYQATAGVALERRKKDKGVQFTINTENPTRYLPD